MWPVVPLCRKQLKDIDPGDVLSAGRYRKCNTYKSGGGYDKFPDIYQKNTNMSANFAKNQFVVQLKGCPLKCPYCYVTDEGINGPFVFTSTEELVSHFNWSDCDVFHLMGGAPALYLEKWKEIHNKVKIFHSDFLLIEKEYKREWIEGLLGIHAVSIKDPSLYPDNSIQLLFNNLMMLNRYDVKYYVTFTGDIPQWLRNEVLHYIGDRFYYDIDIIQYKALKKEEIL